jgi:hypothetical protein
VGLGGGPALFERLAAHCVGDGFGYPYVRPPGALLNMALNAYQYAPDRERTDGLAQVSDLISAHDLLFKDGVITPEEEHAYDTTLTNLCTTVQQLQGIKNVPELWKQVFRDLKTVFEKKGLLESALRSLASILEDGVIDKKDRGALRSLKDSVSAIQGCLEHNGEMHELGEGLLTLLCQLLESVVSGDLVKVSLVTVANKSYLYINVTEPVELRLIQLFIPKDLLDGFPIDLPIALDATVKKDGEVAFCPLYPGPASAPANGMMVEFHPPDAVDLDVDLFLPGAVEVAEKATGIPDLDHFCMKRIKMVDKKLTIEGTSGGKDIRIEVEGGTTSIFVDGHKTFPS